MINLNGNEVRIYDIIMRTHVKSANTQSVCVHVCMSVYVYLCDLCRWVCVRMCVGGNSCMTSRCHMWATFAHFCRRQLHIRMDDSVIFLMHFYTLCCGQYKLSKDCETDKWRKTMKHIYIRSSICRSVTVSYSYVIVHANLKDTVWGSVNN